jgi:hypothetical protein
LAVFNDVPIDGFERIGRLVLSEGMSKITTEQFSSIAIARLVNEGERFVFSAIVLGKAATEEFVRTVLLPHLASYPSHTWIRRAVEIAGNRHNRRYLLNDNDPSNAALGTNSRSKGAARKRRARSVAKC